MTIEVTRKRLECGDDIPCRFESIKDWGDRVCAQAKLTPGEIHFIDAYHAVILTLEDRSDDCLG